MRFLPLAALLLAATPASAAFDEAERQEIRDEIRAYLLENPDILTEMVRLLEAEQAGAQAAADEELIVQHHDAIFEDGFSHVGGNPEGDVTMVEFLDYQCGFCRRAHPEVQTLLESDGDIRFITKEFPILGPGSELASRAAIATLITEGPEAYRKLSDALITREGEITGTSLEAVFETTGIDAEAVRAEMDSDEVTRRIAQTHALARELRIQGTPTFVIGDRMVRGYLPLEEMEAAVEAAREG